LVLPAPAKKINSIDARFLINLTADSLAPDFTGLDNLKPLVANEN